MSQPYALISDTLLARVRAAADGALSAWCRDWGIAADAPVLECARAWDASAQLPAAPGWQAPLIDGAAVLARAWSSEMPAHVQRLLFGSERQYQMADGSAPLAAAAGVAAWQALSEQLARTLLPSVAEAADAAPAAADNWRRASGAVLLVLRLGKQACHLVLNHAAVERFNVGPHDLPPLAPASYRQLLDSQSVLLAVGLGAAEVDLGSLVRLAVGDVVRLDALADRPLTLRGPDGTALCGGYLGRAGPSLALELVPHDLIDGVTHE
ncbi:hypothetical protein GJ699_29820 [Duganella sp. FT80W]|uniref:Flagellar motor switch protein FliN-like C-terminal domain-containing protein n=1 Tax=Duganella guangzhouensis TaxID=2666084 RepID=A0A6I2LD68_9BURK|nr:FliM/FliN family flagellar motor C-terminal domain-containing protein [Duganella guangzhouensis]MRW94179.1 hypothetical protein [Duganella guangzhouensis]